MSALPSLRGRYLAVPVSNRQSQPAGWAVYRLPLGSNSRAAGRYRGPFAGQRAKRRAASLNRKAAPA